MARTFIGREGPCSHCGIEETQLWRAGPPEKPNLCNACGTRWRNKGSLEDYIPKHGFTQRSKENPISGGNKSTGMEENNNDSSLGIMKSAISYCTDSRIPAEKSEVKDFSLGFKVPRSELPQYCLTSTERLRRQLLQILNEQQSAAKTSAAGEEGDDLLIYNTGWMATSSGTALGAMLLK